MRNRFGDRRSGRAGSGGYSKRSGIRSRLLGKQKVQRRRVRQPPQRSASGGPRRRQEVERRSGRGSIGFSWLGRLPVFFLEWFFFLVAGLVVALRAIVRTLLAWSLFNPDPKPKQSEEETLDEEWDYVEEDESFREQSGDEEQCADEDEAKHDAHDWSEPVTSDERIEPSLDGPVSTSVRTSQEALPASDAIHSTREQLDHVEESANISKNASEDGAERSSLPVPYVERKAREPLESAKIASLTDEEDGLPDDELIDQAAALRAVFEEPPSGGSKQEPSNGEMKPTVG
ncbi:MAG: hypothetical protein HQL50_00280 [Magnetococcales bacterium]|nr:hypothetical protein [Magnetococcales bacterium]